MSASNVIANSSITADTAAINEGYVDFGNTLKSLEDVLSNLDGQLSESLKDWSGPAQQAYNSAHDEWKRLTAGLTETLARLHGVLAVVGANYDRCEDSIIRACSQEQP
ncbi:MAG: WXG100 family type VII secretion target [Nocardiopsaceae bacterium]|nr:WXG100 family type VII secretion target [Nocardiopsaceae bacterium]